MAYVRKIPRMSFFLQHGFATKEEKSKKDGVLSSSCCTVGRGCLDTRVPVHPSVHEEKEKPGPWEDVPKDIKKINFAMHV